MSKSQDYRPFKPGDTVYAVGPGLGTYIRDIGKASAEIEVNGQIYVVSIYKIYETSEDDSR